MENLTIKASSPELAKERKLIREIIAFIRKSVVIPYKFRRIDEQYGGHKDGYRADYILIESGKRDRLFQELKISFATQGNDYLHRDTKTKLNRVVVRVSGTARIIITEPREKLLEQSTWGGGSNEITFDRNRDTHVLASTVIRLLMTQQEGFDEARGRVLKDAVRWDKFAADVKRVQRYLNIPEKKIWRGHTNDYSVDLNIPGTKSRKASGKIIMDVYGSIKVRIDDLSEQKLFKVVGAFR